MRNMRRVLCHISSNMYIAYNIGVDIVGKTIYWYLFIFVCFVELSVDGFCSPLSEYATKMQWAARAPNKFYARAAVNFSGDDGESVLCE